MNEGKINKDFLKGIMSSDHRSKPDLTWTEDEEFVQWLMEENDEPREEVLKYRYGMEGFYKAFCGGRDSVKNKSK